MRKYLIAAATLLMMACPAVAWDIDKMNEQVDKTNIVLGDETRPFCSGTIIQNKPEKVLVLTAEHCTGMAFRDIEKEFIDPKTGEVTKKTIREKLDMLIWQNVYKDFRVISSQRYTVEVVASDYTNDLALLKVVDLQFVPEMAAPLASPDYKIRRGETAYVVGNPMGEYDGTVTIGSVGFPERTEELDGRKLKYIQMNMSVVGGNSGGAFYNDNGEIIGLVSAAYRGNNISFAIPVAKVRDLLIKYNTPPAPVGGPFGGPH
jgi:hypothetical protein